MKSLAFITSIIVASLTFASTHSTLIYLDGTGSLNASLATDDAAVLYNLFEDYEVPAKSPATFRVFKLGSYAGLECSYDKDRTSDVLYGCIVYIDTKAKSKSVTVNKKDLYIVATINDVVKAQQLFEALKTDVSPNVRLYQTADKEVEIYCTKNIHSVSNPYSCHISIFSIME